MVFTYPSCINVVKSCSLQHESLTIEPAIVARTASHHVPIEPTIRPKGTARTAANCHSDGKESHHSCRVVVGSPRYTNLPLLLPQSTPQAEFDRCLPIRHVFTGSEAPQKGWARPKGSQGLPILCTRILAKARQSCVDYVAI
jgi:hypothetical protein